MAFGETGETRALVALLEAVGNFAFADGRVDVTEARALIGLVHPFAETDVALAEFENLLREVAEDGVVTDEESALIAAAIASLKQKYRRVEAVHDARALGWPKMGLLGAQHLLAMFGATVLVPVLTGLSISSTLLFAGLGTLLFHFLTKRRVPAFLGSSFAFLPGYMALAALTGGIWEGLTKTQLLAYASVGVAAASLVYFAAAAVVKVYGEQRVKRFFPPVVTGPIIVGIGLGLAPVAVNSAAQCWPVAFVGMAAVLVASVYGRGMVRIVPILVGVLASYAAALVLGNGCGMAGAAVDFSKVAAAPWIGLPFRMDETVFALFGVPGDGWSRVLSALAVVVPLSAATVMEHVGDVSALSSMTGRNYLKDPGLHRTLLGDGLATALAALFGAPANTTYGENTGVLSLSRVYDPRVVRLAAVLAVLLSFSPKFAAAVATLPGATVGGVSFVLYGMIAAVGVRTLVDHQVDFSRARNMLICAVTLVCALGVAFSDAKGVNLVCGSVTLSLSGLAIGALAAILLNAVLPGKDPPAPPERTLASVRPNRWVSEAN